MIARVLYLSNYENFSNGRGLLPQPPHLYPRLIGGDIDGHHGTRLTGDEHYPLASDGYPAVIEATHLIFYSSLNLNVSFPGLPRILLYLSNEIVYCVKNILGRYL